MKKLLVLAFALTMSFSMIGCGADDKKEAAATENTSNAEDKTEEKTEVKEEATEEPEAPAEETKSVDAKALADSLYSEITYADSISEVDLDTASMFLNLAEVGIKEGYIYESSGATAEEIVVLVCNDTDSASKAKTAFEQRVEEQTENFTDYVPEEVPKLNDAVIVVDDVYAVLSVSGDSAKAKSIIESALK